VRSSPKARLNEPLVAAQISSCTLDVLGMSRGRLQSTQASGVFVIPLHPPTRYPRIDATVSVIRRFTGTPRRAPIVVVIVGVVDVVDSVRTEMLTLHAV
jgi:hypothetical protein